MRASLIAAACCLFAALLPSAAFAADLGTKGGPEPGNVDAIAEALRIDDYDIELLISYGTSKGGSAGHLALAIRDEMSGEDVVHSANYYADRTPEHEKDFYTADLMTAVPKKEYLWKTSSSLGGKASFGLDFGETYKRSVIGVRVYGVPKEQDGTSPRSSAASTTTIARGAPTPTIKLARSCTATSISTARRPSGWVSSAVPATRTSSSRARPCCRCASSRRPLTANIPTEMAMKLMKAWNARGYRMDVVLYEKYKHSPYVDPHEEEAVAFKDLPDRFPSVRSRDFRRDEYKDYDNLHAMYLLDGMRRHTVALDASTGNLRIETRTAPLGYGAASQKAAKDAGAGSGSLRK